jgi:hypothetical protein
MKLLLSALTFTGILLLAGCNTAPSDPESTREVALQYIGGDVGTTGPFTRHNQKELEVLSPADRAQAVTVLDRGAQGFAVYEAGSPAATRIVLVQHGKVVGDFRAPGAAPKPAAPTPPPNSAAVPVTIP